MGIESVRGGGLFVADCGFGSGLDAPFVWRRLRVLD